MIIHTDSAERFKSLLRDTFFQFDAAELDFGIYRIMNHRRKEIENFIEKDLIQAVAKEFQVFKAQSLQELLAKVGEKKKEIEKLEKDLGEKILTNGQIEEKFKDRPFAKEYLELKKQLDEVEVTESEQAQVFNDLYIFLSRYYEKVCMFSLPAEPTFNLPESYVDFTAVFTVQTSKLLALESSRFVTIVDPYRIAFAKRFGEFFARVALPKLMRPT